MSGDGTDRSAAPADSPSADAGDDGADAGSGMADPGADDADGSAGDANSRAGGTDGDAGEGHDSLLAALRVRRHARVGLAVGVVLAAVLYLPRLPALDRSIEGAEGFYLGLAFVLAATTAGLVTAALAIKTFLDPVLDRAAWHRRGAVAAILGGLGWASTPLLAAAADAGTIDAGLWRSSTSLACVALLVGAMGLHAAVKPGAVAIGGAIRRIERGAYWLVLVGLLIAAANATGDAAPVTTIDGGRALTPFMLGALVAAAATIPFAAVAELTGRLPSYRIRVLQIGALAGTLATAWLVALDGYGRLSSLGAPAEALALAVALVPVGLGWAIAGAGLWAAASPRRTPRTGDPAGQRDDESTTELDDE